MYLAHAGHDHMSELTESSENLQFVVGAMLLGIALIAVGVLIYNTLESRKSKSKK